MEYNCSSMPPLQQQLSEAAIGSDDIIMDD